MDVLGHRPWVLPPLTCSPRQVLDVPVLLTWQRRWFCPHICSIVQPESVTQELIGFKATCICGHWQARAAHPCRCHCCLLCSRGRHAPPNCPQPHAATAALQAWW